VIDRTILILGEVAGERRRQEERFPGQDLPDGTGGVGHGLYADVIRTGVDEAAADGTLTWWDVLHEEWAEAGAEAAPQPLRAELIQVAAVAVRWVEAIDRRTAAEARLAA
jgi:malonyl CoA-acyl carrier protein transacylase